MDIRVEARKAIEKLSEAHQRLVRDSDAAAVLRTAESLRTSDGLKDTAIPDALQRHGILERTPREQEAYRLFLVNAFLEAHRQKKMGELNASQGH
jgi:hypothetical protein